MTGRRFGISEGVALGCELRVVTTSPRSIEAAHAEVDAVLDSIDRACSRFRPDGELVAMNRSAGRPVTVSGVLGRAIALALRAARLTGGAVDPTVGTAIRLAGYDRDFDQLPPRGAPLRLVAAPVSGWRSVAFDADRSTVVTPPGVELDLGATAKGLAANLAAAAAHRATGGGVMVSIGGDIATAGQPPPGGWLIEVSEASGPVGDGAGGELVRIGAAGIATSSTTVRRWLRGAAELHHLIDPRTGLPVDGPWRTATAVAASCADANIASTAAVVMGAGAEPWLAAAGIPARLVSAGGEIARVGRWPHPVAA